MDNFLDRSNTKRIKEVSERYFYENRGTGRGLRKGDDFAQPSALSNKYGHFRLLGDRILQ